MISILKYNPKSGLTRSKEISFKKWNIKTDELLWIDLDNPTPQEINTTLEDRFAFHPLAIEDCLPKEREPNAVTSHHPKIDDYEDYLFLIFNAITDSKNFKLGSGNLETVQLSAFLGLNYLITIHYEPLSSIGVIQNKCQASSKLLTRGPDFVMHLILDDLIEQYSPLMDKIDDELDKIQEQIFIEPKGETLSYILDIKRQISSLRRISINQKEVIYRLSRGEFSLVSQEESFYYRNVYDHLVRIADLSDSYRDTISGLLDAYLSIASNRLNEVMKLLTIVGTIILPLTLITSIYGMNFEFMPELHWQYGYFVLWAFLILSGVGMVAYFKRRKWV
jgi:magnesium transporter